MRVCARCGTRKFGLTMPKPILAFSGRICFCSKLCKDAYLKEEQERIRKRQFQKWLRSEPSS